MSNTGRFLSVLRMIGKALLLVFCCLATLLAILSAVIKNTLLDESTYVSVTERPGFVEDMTAFVRDELESECLFYDLPFSVIDEALSDARVETFAREYAHNVYETLTTGTALEFPEWQAQPFVDAVNTFFESLPDADRPLDITAADTVGNELSACAFSMLKAGLDEKLLMVGHRVFSHPLLCRLVDWFGWFVTAAVLFATAGLLLAWRQIRYHLYSTALTLGIGSATSFFSFWLLRRYDPASRLALMDSPLKLYVDAVLNAILDEAIYISGWCFGIASVLVLVAIVIQLFPRRAA